MPRPIDRIVGQPIDLMTRMAMGQVSKSGNKLTDGTLSGFEWKTGNIT